MKLPDHRASIRSTHQVEILSPPGTPSSANQPQPATTDSQPILDFVSSDESLDRFDEIICASGWRLDTYRRNPVFQNAHQYGDILFTLGKALITEVRGADAAPSETPHPALRAPHLFQRVQFATDVNPVARIAYGLYKGKFLNAVSVGFIPLRWEDGPKASATGHAGRGYRRKYLEQELLEVSAVGIPANPNALALGLRAGAIAKADLQEMLELLKGLCASSSTGSQALTGPADQLLSLARQLHRILRHA